MPQPHPPVVHNPNYRGIACKKFLAHTPATGFGPRTFIFQPVLPLPLHYHSASSVGRQVGRSVGPYVGSLVVWQVSIIQQENLKKKNKKKIRASKSILTKKKNIYHTVVRQGRHNSQFLSMVGNRQTDRFFFFVSRNQRRNRKDGQTDRQTVFFFHASLARSVRRERDRHA